MKDFILLMGPYESGLFVYKQITYERLKLIMEGNKNAILSYKYPKNQLSNHYRKRIKIERKAFLKKYFTPKTLKYNGVIPENVELI